MQTRVKVALGVVALVVSPFIVLNILSTRQEQFLERGTPFITANPFDLSQVAAISQFRSCEGHNFSGLNADGIEETNRTMKHYLSSIDTLAQTEQQVSVFAPFDGRVSRVAHDSRGSVVYLSPANSRNKWDVILFHVDLLPQFTEKNTQITAGQHIGYANLVDAANFDISMRFFGFGEQRNDSPFFHMTDEVLAEYAAVGVTLDNIIISKEERDARPCQLAPGESGRDAFYARSEAGQSWVELR